jgi:hypothetical protein
VRQYGKAIIRRAIRDMELADGKHVHTVSYSYDEKCEGGDSECALWQMQLEEAVQAWAT